MQDNDSHAAIPVYRVNSNIGSLENKIIFAMVIFGKISVGIKYVHVENNIITAYINFSNMFLAASYLWLSVCY